MRLRRLNRLSAGMVVTLLSAAASVAETPEEKGLAIAREADQRDSGWGDYQTSVTMTLRNKNGGESVREMTIRYLEGDTEGDLSLVVIDRPNDVRDTALLTHAHKTGPDDQWLYLPALKRSKRISSSNQSGPFMGSEFAYEDMAAQEIDKHTYKFLREETLDGVPCFVIERYPANETSGYTRQVAWIDSGEYRIQQVEYYDRKSALLKTLTVEGYQQYLDKYWRAERLNMVNHQTGKSTEMRLTNTEFGKGFTARDFDRNSLARVR